MSTRPSENNRYRSKLKYKHYGAFGSTWKGSGEKASSGGNWRRPSHDDVFDSGVIIEIDHGIPTLS